MVGSNKKGTTTGLLPKTSVRLHLFRLLAGPVRQAGRVSATGCCFLLFRKDGQTGRTEPNQDTARVVDHLYRLYCEQCYVSSVLTRTMSASNRLTDG